MNYFTRTTRCCWLRSKMMISLLLGRKAFNRIWLWSRIREVIYRMRFRSISLFRRFLILSMRNRVIVLKVWRRSLSTLSSKMVWKISHRRIYLMIMGSLNNLKEHRISHGQVDPSTLSLNLHSHRTQTPFR
jgi:hypothetical protein